MDDSAPVTGPTPGAPAAGEDGPITVFLLDDHEVVRKGIADILGTQPDLVVVGEAATAAEALARIPAVRPRVAILDAQLPDGNGIDVCRDIRSAHPEVRCLILTSFDDNDAIFAAVMAGASGYLLKQVRGAAIVDAVRQVAAGRSLLDPSVTERLLTKLREPAPATPNDPIEYLTDREREVLDLIAEGLTNREISRRLDIAEKTVKNYVSAVLAKLGLRSRTQAALYGAERRPH
ncbi:two component transcriptional regulator, LuxR family [Jatrophihabitans endophyticus]|uniref:Two component transcriptional regulator, LuxR family n=1 Tax=Jatrophihabitans endophyticus TaxID=1206085 RepID=A0A1M5CIF9_9ACTN|nr:two component transcriptional regulator, LuxR family [Jatrophihabitans endophyticus]